MTITGFTLFALKDAIVWSLTKCCWVFSSYSKFDPVLYLKFKAVYRLLEIIP